MKNRVEYVQDWLIKASSDLKVALRELSCASPVADAVCFHLQQAVEKILKAWLILNQVEYQKTHNIEILLKSCENMDSSFAQLRRADLLTAYAVEIRYGENFYFPTQEDMKEAAEIAFQVRDFMVNKFIAAGVDPKHIQLEQPKEKDSQ